jgi:putative hydrolase of HD superfamily
MTDTGRANDTGWANDTGGDTERLERQLAFLLEIDKLKRIERQTLITGSSRRENTAEHSWHLAVYAALLAEWSDQPIDLGRVLLLCLVHDIVEIDAGDTFAYDVAGNESKVEREQAAADRLFGLLPDDQRDMMRALWDEYEDGSTPESRFANAVDRLQPVMLNHASKNDAPWKKHNVTLDQVVARNAPIADGSVALWAAARRRIDEVVAEGGIIG